MKTLQVRQNIESLLCAAVDTTSHQHGLEVCTMHAIFGSMVKKTKLYRTNLH
jgi:hypothetical protein